MQYDAPTTTLSATRRWVLSGMVLVMIGVIVFLFRAVDQADERDRRDARLLFEARSAVSLRDIARCLEGLGRNGLALEQTGDGKEGYRGNNAVTKVRVEIRDDGIERVVRIRTPLARPLSEDQAGAVRYCLAAPVR